jgi:hypothetical protein
MSQLGGISHIVVLMLETRSFDHRLGYLYSDGGNKSPAGQPIEGLTGPESNPGSLHRGADGGLESLTKGMICALTPPCDVDVVRA